MYATNCLGLSWTGASLSDDHVSFSAPTATALSAPTLQYDLPPRTGTGATGKPSMTVDQAAVQITRESNGWSSTLGTPSVVTYAFAASGPNAQVSVTGWSPFSSAQITATQFALQTWSDVANITFQRVGSGTSGADAFSNKATMLFNNYSGGTDGQDAAGFAIQPGTKTTAPDASAAGVDGDVYITTKESYNTSSSGLALGGYGLLTLVHEIGHAIGLSHPGDYNAGQGSPTYSKSATYAEDSLQYSIMSYFDPPNTGADYGDYNVAAPQIDDIAAAQRLYGANMTTRTGDTVYGFNSNTNSPIYSITSATQKIVFAVWDAGGNDTFDFSGYSQDQTIDLRATAFSSVGGLKGNVSIAAGVTIENAVGGSGNDTIIGNDADNVITGGGGNDTIDGGGGTNTAVYSGARSNYSLTQNADGTYTVVDNRANSPDGTDTLTRIQKLQFSDQTVSLTAPTLAADTTAEVNQVLRAAPAANISLAAQLDGLSASAATPLILQAAKQTTSVATLSYEFFTGKAPSAGGMDYLVSPTGPNPNNLNASYYQSFNIENRYINFSVNLGKLGEGAAAFQSNYGAKSLFDSTRDAYRTIFGGTPTDDKVHAILDTTFQVGGQTITRAQYFASYGGDGVEGIGTKAAMVGWLLTEAVKADVGVYARANDLFLTDVGMNNAPFGVDLVGKYAKPEFSYGG